MTCFFCKGNLVESFTTHFAEVENCFIIIKNVPCLKCEQCGEVSYTGTVAKHLEEIINSLKGFLTEIAVVNYNDKVA